MSENDSQVSPSLYISIVTGLLLTISEMLPYIKTVRANGIMHLITNFLIEKSVVYNNSLPNQILNQDNVTQHLDQDDERQPLINKRSDTTTHLLSEVSNITITSQNVNFTFHSPNVKLDFNESTN